MPGVKPLPRAAPPKFKIGQWIYYAHVVLESTQPSAPVECSIELVQITNIIDRYVCYDYCTGSRVSGSSYLTPCSMFETFEDAMDYIRQTMKRSRLKILLEHGAIV